MDTEWISIDDETAEFLKNWKRVQRNRMEAMEMKQNPETLVAINELCLQTGPDNFGRWRRTFFVDVGLGCFENERVFVGSDGIERTMRSGYHGYNSHELRNTQVTILIGAGTDKKTGQNRLGHSTASLTIDIYVHAMAQNDRTAADTIGDAVFGTKKEEE